MKLIRSFLKTQKNREIAAQILLFLILFIFLLPSLIGSVGICYDDTAFISFPRLMAAARAFQNGELPLWDSNEYCGAKPFYTMMESPVYNIILYPFYFMANLDDLDQSFLVLYIIPFILLTIFSGFGTYYFFRKVVKSNELISLVCGAAYALNPSIGLSSLSLINTFVFAYIPWILLAIAKFLETHKLRWWLSGILFFMLLNISYNLNYTFRIYFIISFITLILFIWHIIQNRKNYLYILYAMSIFIIAIGLTAFVWSGIIEGLSWVTEDVGGKLGESINDITNSVQPGHLITLFIPGFNGTLDNSHTWGDGFLVHSADTILSGGIITSFLLITSLIIIFKNKKYKLNIDGNLKIWLIIGLTVDIFALLIMLGKYSPFLHLLVKILPWFFAVPYTFYYHFAQHLGTIIAVGTALTILYKIKDKAFEKDKILNKNSIIQKENSSKKTISFIINYKLVLFYLGFIVIFIVVYINLPVYYPDYFVNRQFKNIDTLFFYNDLFWFLTNPVLYFVLISSLLIYSIHYIKKEIKLFLFILLLGVMFESIYSGIPLFYTNENMPRAHSLNSWQYFRSGRHYTFPSEYQYFKQIKELDDKLDKSSSRFTADLSTLENHAWLIDARSFTGYEAKPVMKNMSEIVMDLYDHWPYEMWAYLFPKYLLSNMNVGYILNYNHTLGENEIYDYYEGENKDKLFYSNRSPDSLKNITGKNYHSYFKDPAYKIHELEQPVPYLYFQDKFYAMDLKDQKERLLFTDLRKGALISGSEPPASFAMNGSIDLTGNSYYEFEKLQNEINKIREIDMKKHNKLTLKVKTAKPVLLIRCEAYHPGWKVYINNKKAELIKVNYLQQGVYIKEKGEYEVTYKFLPKSLLIGFFISICFLAMTLVIIIFFLIKKNHTKA